MYDRGLNFYECYYHIFNCVYVCVRVCVCVCVYVCVIFSRAKNKNLNMHRLLVAYKQAKNMTGNVIKSDINRRCLIEFLTCYA